MRPRLPDEWSQGVMVLCLPSSKGPRGWHIHMHVVKVSLLDNVCLDDMVGPEN